MSVTVPGGRYLTAAGWRNAHGDPVDPPEGAAPTGAGKVVEEAALVDAPTESPAEGETEVTVDALTEPLAEGEATAADAPAEPKPVAAPTGAGKDRRGR